MDMVVNPAREDLHLLNGISEVISEAAGPVMQRECTQHVAKHGNIKVTGLVIRQQMIKSVEHIT